MLKIRVLVFGSMLLAFCAGSASAQWVAATGSYSANNWCFAVNGSNIFIGTDDYVYLSTGGAFAHPTNAGLTSGIIRSLVVEGGNLIAGADVVAAAQGGIFYSTDNGATWTPSTGLPNLGVVRVLTMLVNGTDVYAGVYQQGIYKSTDHGASWTKVNDALLGSDKYLSFIKIGGTMYVGLLESGIFSSANGITWTALPNNPTDLNVRSLAYISPNLFAGTPTGLFRTNDAGATASWVDKTTGLTSTYPYSLCANGTYLFAGAAGGGMCSSGSNGDTWLDVNTVSVTNTATASAIMVNAGVIYAATDQGTFTRNVSEALPVELTSFTAAAVSGSVELKWNTATETNNYGFAVERKRTADAVWAKVGFVDGAGTTNAPRSYSYSDKVTTASQYAYRLKQIDRDGKFQYSKSVEVAANQGAASFELTQNYPNPFNPTTTIM